MDPMIWALLASFAGGVALALQAPINARLAQHTGDGMAATAVSFALGFVLLAVATALRGEVPSPARLAAVPWWAWFGGVLGAAYVWSALWSVGTLGVVTLVAAVVAGQMSAALVFDAVGAFGLATREISPQRVLAVVLVGAGLVLSRL